MEQSYIGEVLIRRGVLTPEQVEDALRVAEERGARLTDVLASNRNIDALAVVKALADEVGLPYVTEIEADKVPPDLIERTPINFARQHTVLPVRRDGDAVLVATSDPFDPRPLDDLRVLLDTPVRAIAATHDTIESAINRVYERKDENALSESEKDDDEEELQDLIDMTDEAPVIRWVNNLFYQAMRDRASDIHIEPTEREVVVRYRIDGKLYPVKHAHRGFLSSIIARVKIEANLNIAEKRMPQDGRITKKIHGKLIDVRVSTVPTARGERIVMRLLDKANILLELTDLGLDPGQLHVMEDLITRPNGIILVTGPTGAGKTTTLYACLNKVNKPDVNILTVEDPVEYELPGISQMQIMPKIGLSFASGLRAFLRQDPDVIMVGEIRDHETAEIAIHASLTGHLVLSTLHTNDAAGAITRLGEMGIQSYHVASSLMAVLAQRLVRRLCKQCKKPYFASDEDLRSLGLDPASFSAAPGDRPPSVPPAFMAEDGVDMDEVLVSADFVLDGVQGVDLTKRPVLYQPVGCENCTHTGYRGRVGIYELLVIDEDVRRGITEEVDSKSITRIAVKNGMHTLRHDGARQVLFGTTAIGEVLAATQAGDLG